MYFVKIIKAKTAIIKQYWLMGQKNNVVTQDGGSLICEIMARIAPRDI